MSVVTNCFAAGFAERFGSCLRSSETAPGRKAEVLRAVATERLSLRAGQRVFGVDRHTISRGLQKKLKACRC